MITTKTLPTFTAQIYIGQRLGYVGDYAAPETVYKICQAYVDKVGLALTIEPVQFVYTNGNETGFRIGLIDYPRFPAGPERVKAHALARELLLACKQMNLTVVCSDESILYTNEDRVAEYTNAS